MAASGCASQEPPQGKAPAGGHWGPSLCRPAAEAALDDTGGSVLRPSCLSSLFGFQTLTFAVSWPSFKDFFLSQPRSLKNHKSQLSANIGRGICLTPWRKCHLEGFGLQRGQQALVGAPWWPSWNPCPVSREPGRHRGQNLPTHLARTCPVTAEALLRKCRHGAERTDPVWLCLRVTARALGWCLPPRLTGDAWHLAGFGGRGARMVSCSRRLGEPRDLSPLTPGSRASWPVPCARMSELRIQSPLGRSPCWLRLQPWEESGDSLTSGAKIQVGETSAFLGAGFQSLELSVP